MGEIELKNCPFCGETVKPFFLGTQHTHHWFISYCAGETDSFDTEKELVKAWNKRTEPPNKPNKSKKEG